MKKLDERGVIGLLEVGALVLLLSVIGFTAYRINSINSEVNKSLTNTKDSTESAALQPLALKQEEPEDKPEEVKVPKTETTKEPVATEPVKKTEPEVTKPKIDYIKFSALSAVQDGSSVNASGTLASAQTGTCHFKFKKDGQDKVYTTSAISGSKTCAKSLSTSKFPVGGTWQYHVWFTSSDKSTQAYGDIVSVDITL